MRCPKCGHDNLNRAEICARCGANLAVEAAVHPGGTFRDPDDLSFPADEPDTLLASRRPRHLDATSADEHAPMRDLAAGLRPEAARAARPIPVRYAGFVRRAVAFVIDLIVLAIFSGILTVAGFIALRAGLSIADLPRPYASEDIVTSVLEFGSTLLFVVYFTVLHAGPGQTIGKALVGISVRRMDLRTIGVLRSLIRVLAYVVSAAVFGLGFLIIAIAPRKRGWHDVVAGTCVVRLAPEEV